MPSRVSQKCVTNVGVSDHQLIFYTRKICIIKTGGADKYLNLHSLKNFTADYYKETYIILLVLKEMSYTNYKDTLKQVDFPNYEKVGDVNGAYSNFFQKLMTAIDKIAPYKSSWLKGNGKRNGLMARFWKN